MGGEKRGKEWHSEAKNGEERERDEIEKKD